MDYVPGSARFNGVPVEVEQVGDALTVRGLVLEGSTLGRLTYVVRPRLLGWSRFEGQSSLRGVPISRPEEEPPSGCGCAGGGSGAAALGLVGLATVLRRGRRR
jgi:MYXO-CTERM domain-containing protein